MATIIHTDKIDYNTLDGEEQGWVYNALDCCMTHEVNDALVEKNADYAAASYNFVRAMMGPAMHMSFRGCLIDTNKRGELIRQLEAEKEKYTKRVQRMVAVFWRDDFNPASPDQLKTLLYTVMNVKAEYKWDSATKSRKISTDKNALENIDKGGWFYPRPIVKHVLKIRDLGKKIGVLKTGIDEDGRMRTAYNVSGTETGRWSSKENNFKTGTNLQNITNELREMFIADEGWKMAYLDGEQAESRLVAYESGDENYIAACEGGDLHTYVTRMVWPKLKWGLETDHEHNREVAEQKFYKHWSYRDMAKRLGHGTNYIGSAYQMAKHIHVEKKIVEDFQDIYLNRAFPGIAQWHQTTATLLQTQGYLDTPFGRRRYFFSRLDSEDTLKEAIAYVPQSTIGEWLNLALWRMWYHMDLHGNGDFQCMMQVHDAVLVHYKDISHKFQQDILAKACAYMEFPIKAKYGTFIIPANVEGVGWNWRKYKEGTNNDGLLGLKKDEATNRKRTRSTKEATSVLARRL